MHQIKTLKRHGELGQHRRGQKARVKHKKHLPEREEEEDKQWRIRAEIANST